MLTQIKLLTKLELCNLYQLNVFRFTKDQKAKRKAKGMILLWAFLLLICMFYVGGLSYGLVLLELANVIPAYLITFSSLLIFFIGIFKAGSVIFARHGLDTLCSMPLSQTAIVVSRFLRLYVENLGIAAVFMLPGLAVYARFLHPGTSFYLLGILGTLLIPIAPVAAAALIGALVTGISSRMKHKSLVASGLSVLVVLIVLLGSSQISSLEGNITAQMLKNLSATILAAMEKLYPPAVWLGNALLRESFSVFLGCGILFLALLFSVIGLIAGNFQSICRMLYSTSARHNYRMQTLRRDSVLISLCKREFKGYFSSSVYVSNTIIGPIMGTVLSGALLFIDTEQFLAQLPIAIDLYRIIPFILAGIFCLMTTTCTSVSMEGKSWWIAKSLPLSAKSILDAKILMNLLLILPFFFLSEVLMFFALRPGFPDCLWMFLIPASLILFSCVYGITVNLRFPVLDWDNEVSVIKQSMSSLIGGMGGFLLSLVCLVPAILIPDPYSDLMSPVICLLLLGITVLLYRKNNRTDLLEV